MAKSIQKSIIIIVGTSLTILATSIIFIQTNLQSLQNQQKTRELVSEQISLTVAKLDIYRVINQIDYIAKTIFQLQSISAIHIYDKECSNLRKQPINSKFIWSCESKRPGPNELIFETKSVFSNTSGAPRYIAVRLKQQHTNLFQKTYSYSLIFTLLFIAIALTSLITLIRRGVLGPVDKLKAAILEPGELRINPSIQKSLPLELEPIYKSLLDRDKIIRTANTKLLQREKYKTITEVSQQVSHDIKSPVGTLEIALENIENKKEKSIELINLSIKRIKSILEDLDSGTDSNQDKALEKINIVETIREVITEKQAEHPEATIEINQSHANLHSLANSSDFKRIISNLVNNSVEAAISKEIHIELSINVYLSSIQISILDNGPGVPDHLIKKIFSKDFSSKSHDRGLGLYMGKINIEKWGGTLVCESKKEGGKFIINLPRY